MGRRWLVARIRTIKPEFWTNSTTGQLTGDATKLYLGLHNHCDDYGVIRYDEAEFRARIMPYSRAGAVEKAITELEQAGLDENPFGLVVVFQVARKRYLWLAYFTKHQKVDRPGNPLIEGWTSLSTPLEYADSTNPRESSRALAIVPRGIGEERRGEERTVVDQEDRPRSDVDKVWDTYTHHHPRARGTPDRRRLIKRRLEHYPADTLIAAIHGNHADPHCNGDNDRGQTYHSLELILRSAGHIERYAELATTNGHPNNETRLARARRVTAEREGATP